MPYRVVFAPEAGTQLEALFPLRGVSREDIRPGLRLTHHKGRTVIAYAVDEVSQRVAIVGVFYGGQDHEDALSVIP